MTSAVFEPLHHYRILFSALKKHHQRALSQVVLISLFVGLVSLLNIAIPYLLKQALDALPHGPPRTSYVLVGIYALCWSGAQAAFFWKNIMAASLSARFERALSLALLGKLFRCPFSEQVPPGRSGETYSRFERAATSIGSVTVSVAWSILPAMIELLGAAVMLCLSRLPWLALLLVVTMLGFLAASLYSARVAENIVRNINLQRDSLGGYVIERLGLVPTMHLMNAFAHESHLAQQRYDRWQDVVVRGNRAIGLMYAGKILIIGLGLWLVLWLAAHQVINGSLGLGDFVMVNAYVVQFAMPMTVLASSVFSLQRNFVALKEAADILATADPHDAQLLGPSVHAHARASLVVRDLQVASMASRVMPVSFELAPGRMLGIHGVSGIGKSSLAGALLRLNEFRGTIYLGQLNARECSAADWRRQVVGVRQDAQAFAGSLRDNICYGLEPAPDDASLRHVCHLSCLDDLVAGQPSGLDYQLTANGDNLSGGEKMRLAIARALARNPQVMILDEPTAALDAETERRLLQRIKAQGLATLVISHSHNALKICDHVLEMVEILPVPGATQQSSV